MRVFLVLSALVVMAASRLVVNHPNPPLDSDVIIEFVNNLNTSWTAGRNFDTNLTNIDIRNLCGLKRSPMSSALIPQLDDEQDEDIELPKEFDARKKWSFCKALQEVRDQGPCGSCWAVSTVSAFTDRECIASEGKFNGHLSEQDLLTCSSAGGCDGGSEFRAWKYINDTGICTGGDYGSAEGCQPYTLPPCEHHTSGTRRDCSTYGKVPTPKCQDKCYNNKYTAHTKAQDLYKVKKYFRIKAGNIKQIQRELFKNGPVVAGFEVFEDFLHYKTGVYQHVLGNKPKGHAVKVIGWGTEDETDYWLVANSWNSDWGDNGFFKIKRGTNECDFENEMTAGYPEVRIETFF